MSFVRPTALVSLLAAILTLASLGASAGCSSAASNGGDGGVLEEDGGTTGEDGEVVPVVYTISGTVKGLEGSNLALRVNEETFSVTTNGNFTASAELPAGTAYAITVATQPTSPEQTCTVTGGTGTIAAANVKGVVVDCTTNRYKVGGTVAGLAAGKVTLKNNGGEELVVAQNGTFVFATPVASGKAFDVTVSTQPTMPTQTCTIDEGAGSVSDGDVKNIVVTCVTNAYEVGGTITGLMGNGLVLQNGTEEVRPSNSGAFSFGNSSLSGTPYAVTVRTQPTSPTQVCTVSMGSGTVGGEDVRSIAVTCVTTRFMIRGTVAGMLGSNLVLQNNGGDPVTVTMNGPFQFGMSVPSGDPFNVSVRTQPTLPGQFCTLEHESGNVGDGDVTNILVSCLVPD